MLMIRLQRVGRRNDPSFRLVVTEKSHKPQTGKFLEVLGSYDARKGDPQLKADRIKHWLSVGAQTSDTVHNLLVRGKIIEGKTVNPLPRKSPIAKEVTEESTSDPQPTANDSQPPTENTEESNSEQGDEGETEQSSEETPAEEAEENETPVEPTTEETPEKPTEVEEEKTPETPAAEEPQETKEETIPETKEAPSTNTEGEAESQNGGEISAEGEPEEQKKSKEK